MVNTVHAGVSSPPAIPPPRPCHGARISLAIAAATFLLSCALAGCGGHATKGASASYRGDVLPHAVSLTSADLSEVFQSSQGGSTSLSQQQRGLLMLLYFGYTHCPDVCPTTMVDLASAVRQLSTSMQKQVQVVFVTSDPERDTPSVMKIWLHNFDVSLPRPFVGLTASVKQIDAVATSVGVPLEPPVKQKDGTITVQHGAQTLAFRNGKADVLWTAGTSPADYANDIRLLLGAKS